MQDKPVLSGVGDMMTGNVSSPSGKVMINNRDGATVISVPFNISIRF